jgi:hypothetical protein
MIALHSRFVDLWVPQIGGLILSPQSREASLRARSPSHFALRVHGPTRQPRNHRPLPPPCFFRVRGQSPGLIFALQKDHQFLLHVPRPRSQLLPAISPSQLSSASSSTSPILKKAPTAPLVRADQNPKCPQSDGEKLQPCALVFSAVLLCRLVILKMLRVFECNGCVAGFDPLGDEEEVRIEGVTPVCRTRLRRRWRHPRIEVFLKDGQGSNSTCRSLLEAEARRPRIVPPGLVITSNVCDFLCQFYHLFY